MREGRPSHTALRVALRRAAHQVLDHPRVFDDPLAVRISGLDAESEAANDNRVSRAFRAFMAVRSRYAEDELASAVQRGATQYVVLGAGLDTFAYRNPYPGLQVFEVDHPATQSWKRERLGHSGIEIPDSLTFAPVDFERQALRDGLERAGFGFNAITFFSWLGVTPYLTHEAMLVTLRVIAAMPPGSGVAFDYGIAPSALNFTERLAFKALADRVASAGEPFQLFFKPEELARELRSLGFRKLEDLGRSELNSRYFHDRKDELRITGGLAHMMSAYV